MRFYIGKKMNDEYNSKLSLLSNIQMGGVRDFNK